MACGTVIGANLDEADFGISNAEQGLVTESISITKTKDKTEQRDNCGDIVNVAYYNETAAISITGAGQNESLGIAAVLTLANISDFSSGMVPSPNAILVDEVQISRTNEDFVKTTISATSYEGISSVA